MILTALVGNMIIPFLAINSTALLLALIPVVLVETLIIRWFVPKKFGTALLAVTVANLLSALVGVLATPVGILLQVLPSPLGETFFWLCPFVISFFIELAYFRRKWPEQAKPLLRKATLAANLASYLPLMLLSFSLTDIYMDKRMERPRRIACASNLKQIGLALSQYAKDNKGFFPPANGVAGFELLRRGDYLADRKQYRCPSVKKAGRKEAGPFTEDDVDYQYFGGLNEKSPSASPLACDKPGNHHQFRNVLRRDGGLDHEEAPPQ